MILEVATDCSRDFLLFAEKGMQVDAVSKLKQTPEVAAIIDTLKDRAEEALGV